MTEAEILEHITKTKDPPGLDKHIKNNCSTHYIFYNNVIKEATCTRCEKTYDTPGNYEHKTQAKCPKCHSLLEVRSEGLGRNGIEDTFRLMTYTRYRKTIYAKLYYVSIKYNKRNITGRYENKAVINKELKYFYIFNKEGSRSCYKDIDYRTNEPRWYERKSTGCNIPNPNGGIYWYYCSKYDNLVTYPQMESYTYYRDMFEKSDAKHLFDNLNVFNHIRVSDRENELMLKYLEYGLKNQSIELLAKAGFESLVIDRIHGCTGGCNWRGTTLTKILGVPRRDFKTIKEENLSLGQLDIFKKIPEEDRNALPHRIVMSIVEGYRNGPETIETLKEYVKLKKWGTYIQEQTIQYARKTKEKEHRPYDDMIGDYIDYLKMAKELGMDLRRNSVLYPKDLVEAHDDVATKVSDMKDEILNKEIESHALNIEYQNMDNGLKIIVPISQAMLNKESSGLNHCVKTYGDKLSKGKCRIFFIRKTDAEDVPFYTLETRPDGEFVQCRGKNNCSMTEEIEQFKDEFIKYLKKEIKKGNRKPCQKKIA